MKEESLRRLQLKSNIRRGLGIGLFVLSGLIGSVQVAAADPFCPNNGPASLDPAFAALVQQVGGNVVGSVTACTYRAGNTGIFNQQTSLGSLNHAPDGTVTFVSSYQSSTPNRTWTMQPDGTFITPDGQRTQTGTAPAVATAPVVNIDPTPVEAPSQILPADDPAVAADGITPGRYACYAQWGGSSSAQVLRAGGGITKEIHADGTWRDTSYGSMTANDPRYAGSWDFDGTTLTLTWGVSGEQDTFGPQIRTSGQPQLVQFGDDQSNMTCFLVQ